MKKKKADKNSRIKTSIVVNEERWRHFGAILRRKGLDYSAALDALVAEFISKEVANPKKGSDVPAPAHKLPSREELHQLLDEIYDDGTLHIYAIANNLHLLAFALRLVGKYSDAEIDRIYKLLKQSEAIPPKAE